MTQEHKDKLQIEFGLCSCDVAYTSRGLTAPDCPMHAYAIEEYGDEYARQMAIGFAEWVGKNYNKSHATKEDGSPLFYRGQGLSNRFTLFELYDLFNPPQKQGS